MEILLFQPAIISKGKTSFSAISNGLMALGMYLKQKGYNTKICHFNGAKNLEGLVKEKIQKYHPRHVGVGLTWHNHCCPAIKIAQAVKESNPDTKTVFGGFTASFFDREILEHSKKLELDNLLIIRGDGEEPLLELIETGKVPVSNTSLYQNGRFIRNPLSYVQTELPRVRLDYSVTELIDDWQTYLEREQLRTSVPGLKNKVGHSTARGEFHLYVGKGCRNNCYYCGGGREAHRMISGRKRIQFRGIEDVIVDLNQLVKDGVRTLYIDFDPDPRRKFYLELLKKLNPQDARLMFSAWCGPLSLELQDEISKKFADTEIVISPESGSERLRRELINQGYGKPPFYSNNDLIEFFGQLQEGGSKAMCYFISGIPGETEDDRKATLALAKRIREKYGDIFIKEYDSTIERNLCAPPLYVEPCSPLQRNSSIGFRDYLKPEKVPVLNPKSLGQNSEFRKAISGGKND